MRRINKAAALHELGEAIADVRKKRGMSLPELAPKAGLEAGTLEQIEQGAYDAEYTTLLAIAKALETKFVYMLPPLN